MVGADRFGSRGFCAASQAATAVTAAYTLSYTGLCLSNPAASGRRAYLLGVGITLSAAPAAIAPMGLMGGWVSTGVTAHTTPLTVTRSTMGVQSEVARCLADGAATIVGTPRLIMPLLGGYTAAALFPTSPSYVRIDGHIAIEPGGWVAIYALLGVSGLFGMVWVEEDLT